MIVHVLWLMMTVLQRVMAGLDPPVIMSPCTTHSDCADSTVQAAHGQYCLPFKQNKCTFKKVSSIWLI